MVDIRFGRNAWCSSSLNKNRIAYQMTRTQVLFHDNLMRWSVQASRSFVQDAVLAWKELSSSVAVQNDKRIVIAVRRSTVEFAGHALLWTIFSVILARLLLVLAKRFQWGWGKGFNWPRLSRVRDRSLGGKEVVVSKGLKLWESGPVVKKPANKETRGLGPLDSVIANSCSEKELHQLRNNKVTPTFSKVKGGGQLPVWWLASDLSPCMHPQVSMQAQRDAYILLHGRELTLHWNMYVFMMLKPEEQFGILQLEFCSGVGWCWHSIITLNLWQKQHRNCCLLQPCTMSLQHIGERYNHWKHGECRPGYWLHFGTALNVSGAFFVQIWWRKG